MVLVESDPVVAGPCAVVSERAVLAGALALGLGAGVVEGAGVITVTGFGTMATGAVGSTCKRKAPSTRGPSDFILGIRFA